MADLLPSTPDTSAADEAEPRVIGLDDEETGELLSALSSDTAREVLAALHDEPDTPSGVADRVDTSLQNAQYHLGRMRDAGVIDVIDTIYSEKGREMEVYAPADRPLVVFAGRSEEKSGLGAALRNLIGGVAGLAGVSALVEWALRDGPWLPSMAAAGGAGGGSGRATETAVSLASADAGAAAGSGAAGLPPGLLFFLGGLVVLLAALVVGYVLRR
ncbi:MAG: ArsR/SmtB family transcription factor [Haloferacaceae archaeon]